MFVSESSRRLAMEQAAATPLRGELQDFGLTYQRSLDDGRARLQSVSRERAMADWYDRYIDEISTTTGKRLENPWWGNASSPAFSLPGPDGASPDDFSTRVDRFDAQVRELADKTTGLQIKTWADAEADVFAAARNAKAAAERPGVSVGWSGLGRFVGYGQAAMEDPANIAATVATLGLGGGEAAGAVAAARATLAARLASVAKPVAVTTLREGAVNAATEASIQPSVMRFNQDAGIPYTVGDAAEQVAMAGAAGGVVGGGLHAAGLGLKGLLSQWNAAKTAGHVAAEADTDAAERVLQVVADRRADNPFPPGPEGDRFFAEADADVLRALREGRPIPAEVEQRWRDHRRQGIADLAARVGAGADDKVDLVAWGVLPPTQHALIHDRVRAINPQLRDGKLEHAVRRVDAGGIRHALDRHGNDEVPFRVEDAVHAPDVVENGALVRIEPDHHTGLPYVEWRMLVNGNWLHVGEEVVGERNVTLRTKTMFWNKGPGNNGAGGPKGGNRPVAPVSPAAMPENAAPRLTPAAIGDSPASRNMRAAPAERKTLPPELSAPSSRRPETLVGWLKRQGGVKDADGWLAHMGVDNSVRPGLISGRGLQLDDAALRAWEEGFFPEFADRPTPDQLRLHMADELGPEGMDRVRGADEGARLEWGAYDDMMAELGRLGVDPWGKSWADVQAAVKVARDAERAEGDMWKDALAFIDGDAAKALDEDAARIAQARGDLLAEDVAVPTGLTGDDGKAVTVSARDAMDVLDNEADAWDSATFCMGRVA